MPAYISFTQK